MDLTLQNWMAAAWACVLPFVISCSTTAPKTGVLAPTCSHDTPVRETDMETFGFKPAPGKIVVMRIFASWCPYCKTDLNKIALEFQNKRWTPANVNLFLLAYDNHDETRATFDAFVKNSLGHLGIPLEAVQIQFMDKTFIEARDLKSSAGEPLFTGWNGIPFALVFGKDGRLAYRGHFTQNDVTENAHYRFITELQKEKCPL